jgi:hypothetical protein
MSDLPQATEAAERYALERVGPGWRTTPPEEWIARNIHLFPLWGWADYRFADAEFDAWIHEAGRIASDVAGRRALRERYLTPGEIAEAEEYEADPF